MSFNSRDLMIDVLPTVQPGLVLCGQATAGGGDEKGGGKCGQATAPEPTALHSGLALLRHQLHETLTAETRA
jgi:hypothetical protein